jgi:hypothetical protein
LTFQTAIRNWDLLKMARGKYLSLEEARKTKSLGRFAKEHPSKADRNAFNALLDAMCLSAPPKSPEEGGQS